MQHACWEVKQTFTNFGLKTMKVTTFETWAYTRAICKVRGLTLLLRVGTL
jgi:hypothetical protein